ncbi:hypothetical protein T06_13829 [Trichinella sp. T6]|nr:hypothetical protein T06_13829 [Trichinella sp. T6]
MKRVDAVLNQVCSVAINYPKAQKNVEVSCQAAYLLEHPHSIIVYAAHFEQHLHKNAILRNTSDAEDEDKEFDYCSVHVSTMISHVSQQFRFLVFFIVTVRMNFMHFVIAMGCVSAVELFL